MAQVENIVEEVVNEFDRATKKFGSFNTNHEGYAVLLEEVDELWHEVKHGSYRYARAEAIQVAAMAIRFIFDGDNRLHGPNNPPANSKKRT